MIEYRNVANNGCQIETKYQPFSIYANRRDCIHFGESHCDFFCHKKLPVGFSRGKFRLFGILKSGLLRCLADEVFGQYVPIVLTQRSETLRFP